jgi:hypothetical protein
MELSGNAILKLFFSSVKSRNILGYTDEEWLASPTFGLTIFIMRSESINHVHFKNKPEFKP